MKTTPVDDVIDTTHFGEELVKTAALKPGFSPAKCGKCVGSVSRTTV